MKKVYQKLVLYSVRLLCDCEGEMNRVGTAYWNGSGTYESHRCDRCGTTVELKNEAYPNQVMRPEDWTPPAE